MTPVDPKVEAKARELFAAAHPDRTWEGGSTCRSWWRRKARKALGL